MPLPGLESKPKILPVVDNYTCRLLRIHDQDDDSRDNCDRHAWQREFVVEIKGEYTSTLDIEPKIVYLVHDCCSTRMQRMSNFSFVWRNGFFCFRTKTEQWYIDKAFTPHVSADVIKRVLFLNVRRRQNKLLFLFFVKRVI